MKKTLILTVISFILAGCSDPNTLRVGVAAPDSDYHRYTVMLNHKLAEKGIDLNLKPVFTESSAASVRLLNNGVVDLAVVEGTSLKQALKKEPRETLSFAGEGFIEKNYEVRNNRDEVEIYNSSVAGVFDETLHVIVNANSSIDDLYDLSGKNTVIGTNDPSFLSLSHEILKLHGISELSHRIGVYAPKKAVELFLSNSADALILFDKTPSVLVSELAKVKKIRLLSLQPEIVENISRHITSLSSDSIEAGLYEGQKNAVSTFKVKILLQTNNCIDNTQIAKLISALFDLDSTNTGKQNQKIGAMLKEATVPQMKLEFHPEAFDFYEKHGVSVTESKNIKPLFDIHIMAAQD